MFSWLSRRENRRPQPTQHRPGTRRGRVALRVEELEPRLVLANHLFSAPGNTGDQTRLSFNLTAHGGVFNDEIGVYAVQDTDGRVNGMLPTDPGYAGAALRGGQILFHSGQDAGASAIVNFAAGQQLAFFLVQNTSTVDARLNNPSDSNDGAGPLVFFSVSGANPDHFDHVQDSAPSTGTMQFSWEDLEGGGDKDFNDMVFTVSREGTNSVRVPGPAGRTNATTFSWLSRDAVYNNELGLFIADNASGSIGGLNPGDPGYSRAALSSSTRQVLFASGQGPGATSTVNLPDGAVYGLYLVANGSTADALSRNPDDRPTDPIFGGAGPFTYFSFAAANPDGLPHLRWLSDTDFAFEDSFNGGDQDFNDLVGRVSFGTPPDTTPPTIAAQLANDTGASSTDKITSDPTVKGSLTESGTVTRFTAGLDSTQPANFTNVLSNLQSDKTFTLTSATLMQINGGMALADGARTLHLQAQDNSNNASAVFDLTFTLDTTPPAQPNFDLDSASDTGTKGDHQTTLATVTLTGKTDPNTAVQLVQTNANTTADASGNFTFSGVTLTAGANTFTVKATDTAGNSSQANQMIARTATTPTNGTPTASSPIGDRSLARNASQTIDLAGNFTDPDITDTMLRLNTSSGAVNVELFDKQAPRTVANFLNYVTSGRYTESIFHRSAKLPGGTPFVLQSGGFTFNTNPSRLDPIATDPAVQNEPDPTNRSNLRGTLAMAKLGTDPNSATDQFFFNLGDNSGNLNNQNGGFTVFGKVVSAADQQVVDALAAIPTKDESQGPALPASEKGPAGQGVFSEIPLQNYSGTNFPADTSAANYALVSSATIASRGDFLTYSVVGNTNPQVVTTSVNNNRLTLQARQAGTTTLTVRATDQKGATVDTTFKVTVA